MNRAPSDAAPVDTDRAAGGSSRQPGAPSVWIGSLIEGAREARGVVAIIDVFRAFTTAAVVLGNGASRIVMVDDVDRATALRAAGVAHVCIGEVMERIPAGFDFGNSPHAVSEVDFSGKTVVQRTSSGTQGIAAAADAERLYAASLVTVSATARAMLEPPCGRMSIVPMGWAGLERTDEDELCALHLRTRLEGRPGNPAAVRDVILAGGDVLRFYETDRADLDPRDVDIALEIDRYDFAIRVTRENGLMVARRES